MPLHGGFADKCADEKRREAIALRNTVSYHCHLSETEHEVRVRIYLKSGRITKQKRSVVKTILIR